MSDRDPNGTIVLDEIWTPAQWNTAWESKADANNPNITGGIAQTVTTAWSGSTFPGVNNLASYSAQAFSGSPTASYGDSGGTEIPFNLITIVDTINWNPGGAAGVIGWDLVHRWGGSGTTGSRSAAQIDLYMTGAVPWFSGIGQVGITVHSGAGANYSGAASGSGNGRGQMYCESFYWGAIASGIFFHELTGAEWDFVPQSGSSSDYVYGLKIVNLAPSGWVGNIYQAMLTFASTNTGGVSPHIITFGDPQQAPGFPASSTGDLIYSFTGTTGTAIDFSLLTTTSALIKAANFKVDSNGYTHTNRVYAFSGTTVDFMNPSDAPGLVVNLPSSIASFVGISPQASGAGAPIIQFASTGSGSDLGGRFQTANGDVAAFTFMDSAARPDFVINQVHTPVSWPTVTPAASGNILIDVGGTGTGISIGPSGATGIVLGKSGGALGFYGTTAASKPTVTGSKASNAALASLLTSLATLGILTDSST